MEIEEWQKGEHSILTPLQRLILHEEWLKKIHKQLRPDIEDNISKEDCSTIHGFID